MEAQNRGRCPYGKWFRGKFLVHRLVMATAILWPGQPTAWVFQVMQRLGRGLNNGRGAWADDYTEPLMTFSPPPSNELLGVRQGRGRRDRLLSASNATPHVVFHEAFVRLTERLKDIRLGPGVRLVIHPEAPRFIKSYEKHLPFVDGSYEWADPFSCSRPTDQPIAGDPRRRGFLARWLSRQQQPKLIHPNAQGHFSGVPSDCFSLVIDTGGLLVGWSPQEWFKEMIRMVKPGGLYFMMGIGPLSLASLWACWGRHVPASPTWVDLHDIGDALGEAGFAAPVMESERITLSYASPDRALQDIKSFPVRTRLAHGDLGGGGLMGRAATGALRGALEAQRGPDQRVELSVELVIGHAWKPVKGAPKAPSSAAEKPILWSGAIGSRP